MKHRIDRPNRSWFVWSGWTYLTPGDMLLVVDLGPSVGRAEVPVLSALVYVGSLAAAITGVKILAHQSGFAFTTPSREVHRDRIYARVVPSRLTDVPWDRLSPGIPN